MGTHNNLSIVFALGLTVVLFAATADAAAGLPQAGGQTVEARLLEYKIEMPATLSAGVTTFKVINAGHHKHNLKIKGPGINKKLAADLKGGETGDLQIDLKAGTYQVTCPVGFHKRKGMSMVLTVTPKQTSE